MSFVVRAENPDSFNAFEAAILDGLPENLTPYAAMEHLARALILQLDGYKNAAAARNCLHRNGTLLSKMALIAPDRHDAVIHCASEVLERIARATPPPRPKRG